MASTQLNEDPIDKTMSFPRTTDDDIFGQVALGLLALIIIAAVLIAVVS